MIDDAKSEGGSSFPRPDAEMWERATSQMWQLYFQPELDRRQQAGELTEDFTIYMAQVLIPPDGTAKVLFNDEAVGEGLLRAPRPVAAGEAIQVSDIQHLEAFDLPESLIDNGHFTIISVGPKWHVFFNFLSGRAKSRDMLERASQFLQVAQYSLTNSLVGPAIDNLFSASELISKSELILRRNPAASSGKHKAVHTQINLWGKVGNIDAAFVDLFNRLSLERPAARYGNRKSQPSMPTQDDVAIVEAMIERGLRLSERSMDRVT